MPICDVHTGSVSALHTGADANKAQRSHAPEIGTMSLPSSSQGAATQPCHSAATAWVKGKCEDAGAAKSDVRLGSSRLPSHPQDGTNIASNDAPNTAHDATTSLTGHIRA